jgi:hypothetical protein
MHHCYDLFNDDCQFQENFFLLPDNGSEIVFVNRR